MKLRRKLLLQRSFLIINFNSVSIGLVGIFCVCWLHERRTILHERNRAVWPLSSFPLFKCESVCICVYIRVVLIKSTVLQSTDTVINTKQRSNSSDFLFSHFHDKKNREKKHFFKHKNLLNKISKIRTKIIVLNLCICASPTQYQYQ